MAKKNIVLLLSRNYPLTHSKAGKPTNYAEKIKSGEKIHTIRTNYERWKHNIDKMKSGNYRISIRQWSGRPYHSKQIEVASFDDPNISVQKVRISWDALTRTMDVVVDESHSADVRDLARNDGMDDLNDFREWFFGKDKPKDGATFRGAIIHFTDFQY